MIENHHEPEPQIDTYVDGRLAAALFGGVVVILLIMIYGLAMAA